MWNRIWPLIVIFIFSSLAWVILGSITKVRSFSQDKKLKRSVGQLWGTTQEQQAPAVYISTKDKNQTLLDSSDISVNFELEHRKKGLLWYSTYHVTFLGKYIIVNKTNKNQDVYFDWTFPTESGIYDDFSFVADGKKITDLTPSSGMINKKFNLDSAETKIVQISYKTQGLDEWWYRFGEYVSQVQNFNLTMTTNFNKIDFPDNAISPTKKEKIDKGWRLTWNYSNLISGIQIGMIMPQKINPGPFVSKISFFAPVSLFLFLFLMLIITTVKKINIHPMNYFFIAAAFFSFHLLMAYLADHIDIYLAFVICSAVSIFLVTSYMRLVVGIKFALLEIGLSQFVYLVLFSSAFFLKGYTGLSITICCIITLFIIMQYTGRIDWSKQ